MVTGTPPPTSDATQIRSELLSIIDATELLAQRLRDLHSSIPISPRDDLMLAGEEDPDFLHVARIVIECAQGDYLAPLLRDLRRVLEHRD